MNPNIWGPPAWKYLHSVTLGYPECPSEEDKKRMYTFMTSVGPVLPCFKCRDNFEAHLEKYPLDEKTLGSRSELVKWLINIHNDVNRYNNKAVLSYEDALSHILDPYKSEILSCGVITTFVAIIVVLIVFIYYGLPHLRGRLVRK